MKKSILFISFLLLISCTSSNSNNNSSTNSNMNDDTFHVTFLDGNNEILSELDVKKNESIYYNGPEPTLVSPNSKYEYDFYKWDHNLDNITSSLVIKPLFHKISTVEIIRGTNIYREILDDTNKVIAYEFYQYRIQDDESIFEVPSSYNNLPILRIGYAAFFECSNKEVILPSTVEVIDNYAFNSCFNLEKINIPESLIAIKDAAFYLTTKLKSIDLNMVSYIGNDNFFLCTSLEEFKVNKNNTQFNVFEKVLYTKDLKKLLRAPDNIEKLSFAPSLLTFENEALSRLLRIDEIVIPNSVIALSDNLFYESKIKKVTLNGTYISLNNNLFHSCSLLKEVIIHAPIKYVLERVFYKCLALESINLIDSIEEIGEFAFAYCSLLKTIILPSSLKKFGYGAFDELVSLENFIINESNKTFKVVDGNLYAKDMSIIYKVCETKKVVKFNEGLKTIGSGSLYNCIYLEDITLPSSLTKIEDFAFYNCNKVKKLTIPDSVNTIEHHAFALMESLISIHLPTLLDIINENLFDTCESLVEINIPYNVTKIANYAFNGCLVLPSLSISKNIKAFGKESFASCNALETIYYEGNEEEWLLIENLDVSSLTKQTNIIYNCKY